VKGILTCWGSSKGGDSKVVGNVEFSTELSAARTKKKTKTRTEKKSKELKLLLQATSSLLSPFAEFARCNKRARKNQMRFVDKLTRKISSAA
jgi:hypothetical protein